MSAKKLSYVEIKDAIAERIRQILVLLGEDPDREGLKKTPQRVAQSLLDMTSGYRMRAELEVKFTEHSDMVILKGIGFASLCEHHLLPFWGEVDIAYIPRRRVVGASKLVRLVQKHALRFQIQERMTRDIADELWRGLKNAYGVMVIVRAQHMCMMVRGVKNLGELVTCACRGVFLYQEAPRNEAFELLKRE